MRQVLSISLPGAVIKTIKAKTKKRGFKSVSEYMKFLIKEDDGWISEEQLLEDRKIA